MRITGWLLIALLIPLAATQIQTIDLSWGADSAGKFTLGGATPYRYDVAPNGAVYSRGGSSGMLSYPISQDSDDGTEQNQAYWFINGFMPPFTHLWMNRIGLNHDLRYDSGLRFQADDLTQGQTVAFARLRLPSTGSSITSRASLLIEGVLQPNPTSFNETDRPSQKLPKTVASQTWEIEEEWLAGSDNTPLYYASPEITPIINEILGQPDWNDPPTDASLIITINDNGSSTAESNVVYFEDTKTTAFNYVSTPAILDVCPTVYDTFVGKELLGRVTDQSATVNVYSLIETDVYAVYGTTPGVYPNSTAYYLNQPAEQGIDILITDLAPNTRYYYRLAYRRAGADEYSLGEEHSFQTQRPAGASFDFAVIADEHFPHGLPQPDGAVDLYATTLANIAAGEPDFLVSLGDIVNLDDCGDDPSGRIFREIKNLEEAKQRYLNPRRLMNDISHSIPFYLTLGNHENEKGWLYDFENPGSNADSLAILGIRARKELLPNPYPDGFFTGDETEVPECGLREAYYAWIWGDAHFIVLDVLWNTKQNPKDVQDNWEWTLGKEQYDWLYETLTNSSCKWKFVFIHHLTSSYSYAGSPYYGRGGIEIAKFKVAHVPSCEWGGEDYTGQNVFSTKRPDWNHGPIHDMLAAADVNIVFHGHDHLYAQQTLDGIVYQEGPVPNHANYDGGFINNGGYEQGTILPNSGHLDVAVNPDFIKVEYVRAFLPGDGENGQVSHQYYVGITGDIDHDGDVDISDLAELLGAYGDDHGGDIDKDGDTDLDDLSLLLANYGVDHS